MTVTLIIAGGLVAFAVFIAGCFVGHRTGRQEGSASAARWSEKYASHHPMTVSKQEKEFLEKADGRWIYCGGGEYAFRPYPKPPSKESA